ncbi:LysM peptidoglycan-binding domain-containing protein [Weissella cibaria]|uniref:LysM peptidoglycan-binding domain-containing protein n=1 Tax=Weissella cibaria TaxID=137591 RepID=UPI00106E860A|nr:LysM domain-containing protein [Weissella cibaria]MBZ5942969.1 LysM domain-containing protein [Weissella cibaria]TVV28652.1 LysM peptidoglycan-binding domain-containing protein [Weissella cibaria]
MEPKRPTRLQFWSVIAVGYVILFAVGFFAPVAVDAVGDVFKSPETTETTSAKSSSTKSESKADPETATTEKAADVDTASEAIESEVSAATGGSTSDSDDATDASASSTVVVKAGTTAFAIAKSHGLTLAQLQVLNPGVDMNGVQAGQTLVVRQ